jgi:LysM repeat protein
MTKKSLCVLFLYLASHLYSQVGDSLPLETNFVQLTPSSNLNLSLNKLRLIKEGNDTVFTIMHLGDSHIQGDHFSGEIRKSLHSTFGNAGQGILFPYSLSKSYGPRGIKISPLGTWTGTNIMNYKSSEKISATGYVCSTKSSSASIDFDLTDKFTGARSHSIRIWYTSGEQYHDFEMNKELKLVEEKIYADGLAQRTYISDSIIDHFNLRVKSVSDSSQQFTLHGFEFLSDEKSGINYNHFGVVGAQFSHFIKNSTYAFTQIEALQPDLILFSFGTNEAYDNSIDTNKYYTALTQMIQLIKTISPKTAIIFTTAPDTRSQGRVPVNQINVNNQLKKAAINNDASLYDLNAAMGGWGSMNSWSKNQLSQGDKLHFNATGYALQGKMFSYSFLEAYNKENINDTISIINLKNQLIDQLKFLTGNKTIVVDTIPKQQRIIQNPYQYHQVKSGETVSSIARKYHVSAQKIISVNNLNKNGLIRTGQRLRIPN